MRVPRLLTPWQNPDRQLTAADAVILLGVVAVFGFGVRLAVASPESVSGPEISLSPAALPSYALQSLWRMTASYILSLVFSIVYGFWAAKSRKHERVLLPILDILQSVPILSFLPVVLLSLSAFLPVRVATEVSSVLLIFSCQAWNIAFSWYQSLKTIPKDLRDAANMFQLNKWFVFRTLQLPFGIIGLVWNSMMSWAGGWFFLMAAETFQLGPKDFRLPGLGSYLQAAAHQGEPQAIFLGLAVLTIIIVALDQLLWRPLLAWSHRFRLDMVSDEDEPTSWFRDLLMGSNLVTRVRREIIRPLSEKIDFLILRRSNPVERSFSQRTSRKWIQIGVGVGLAALLSHWIWQAFLLLLQLTWGEWLTVLVAIGATLSRVVVALLLTLGWTVPVGIAIGMNKKMAKWVQPMAQLVAAIPATALFPVFVVAFVEMAGGLDIAAVVLMMAGTQWYVLFIVIAGASAIPRDLLYTAQLMHFSRWDKWKTFLLPGLFPYLITGCVTATGGAWNASIVAEYVVFDAKIYKTVGAGSLIASATASAHYPLLLAGTLAMVTVVVLVNRIVWRTLYKLAEDRFRME